MVLATLVEVGPPALFAIIALLALGALFSTFAATRESWRRLAVERTEPVATSEVRVRVRSFAPAPTARVITLAARRSVRPVMALRAAA